MNRNASFESGMSSTGDVIRNNDRYSSTGSVNGFGLKAAFTGLMKFTDTSVNLKGDLSYNLFGSGDYTVFTSGGYSLTSRGSLTKHQLSLSVNVRNY